MPISKIGGGEILDLSAGVNPQWSAEARNFLKYFPEGAALSKSGWTKIKDRVAPYANWLAAAPKTKTAVLGRERIEILLGENLCDSLLGLVEKDLEMKPQADAVKDLHKLVLFNKNLGKFLRNYVNFSEFYRGKTAIFQYGKLFLDRRECSLCLKVEDISKHALTAPMSYTFLVYCACTRKGMPPVNIVAAVTAGQADNLIAGKKGVFFDRLGLDWDATVIRIVENPIGISQAFWSPYKRCMRWASEQIAKRAAAADTSAVNSVTASVDSKNPPKKIDVGTVAALGVAVSGITAVFGMLLETFFGLGIWMPLGIVGAILAISLPSMLIASMKLRQRNLGPILDSNFWAVNTPAKMSIAFGGALTRTANTHVSGAKIKIISAAILALMLFWSAWYFGCINKNFPDCGLPESSYVAAKKTQCEKSAASANAPAAPENAAKPAAK